MPRPDTATTYVPRRQAAPKRRWARTALIAGLCVVLVAAVVAGGYIANLAALYNDRSTTIAGVFPADEGRPAKPVDDGSRNILLLGSDSRGEGLDTAENKGSGKEGSGKEGPGKENGDPGKEGSAKEGPGKEGPGKEGSGTLDTQSGVLRSHPYSFRTRFEGAQGALLDVDLAERANAIEDPEAR